MIKTMYNVEVSFKMSDVFQNRNSLYLEIPSWQNLNSNLLVGFSTRNDGISLAPYDTLNLGLHVDDDQEHIITNRKKLAEKLSIPLDDWVAAEQLHGTNIHVVNQSDKGKGSISINSALKDVDGLITNEKGILCTAFFADCVPLFFFDPVTSYIGIAHAGWRGTVNKMAFEMVKRFQTLGVNKSDLLVVIGPSISQQYYEVDNNVIKHIDKQFMDNAVFQSSEKKYKLDLKQLNYEFLLNAGINKKNIQKSLLCTYKEDDLFFSYRRDHGTTGRMLGFIGYQS